MEDIKRLPISEFIAVGYLQEVNRLFFHPLGLALEVEAVSDDYAVMSVWDYRDDPEGIYYGDDLLSVEKALKVAGEVLDRAHTRSSALGYVIQNPER